MKRRPTTAAAAASLVLLLAASGLNASRTLPAPEKIVLPNGLTVLIVSDRRAPCRWSAGA